MKKLALSLVVLQCALLPGTGWSAKAPAKPTTKAAAVKKPAAPKATTAAATSPTAPPAGSVKQIKEGELDVSIRGERKDKMVVGKIDPPAAFNLEDIQNFPEDRLHPVLNNPIVFDEARDFSSMMDSLDDKIVHPWLPEIAKAPFLTMKVELEKPVKDWRFSVIDQGGAPVSSQDGKGTPPQFFHWTGDDKDRGHIAVDTVYIPQLSTTDKEGYRRTYMGHPSQFASFVTADKGRSVIELSSKRLFLENKSELTKEAPVFLDKVCDFIRTGAFIPFSVQAYDSNPGLGRSRVDTLVTYFSQQLLIPKNQITALDTLSQDKRGTAIAITVNGTPGGND
jgi:hypothetical protein